MDIIEQFHPPALLPDADRITGFRSEWGQAISDWLDDAVNVQHRTFYKQGIRDAEVQFFNFTKQPFVGRILQQPVVWNAFPKELLRKLTLKGALIAADNLLSFAEWIKKTRNIPGSFRQGSEYCEWRVTRDSPSSPIRKIVFTSEPPEYWRAMFGGSFEYSSDTGQSSKFLGDPDVVLQLYKELVSDDVKLDDLRAPDDIPGNDLFPDIKKNDYNPFNRWNTVDGIVHLTHPSNSILAEMNLAAAATILREDSRGRLLVQPEELICCAGYGNPNRNSDPTIGAVLNSLARQGAKISLQDPVGVYMDHIDLAGWLSPSDEDVSNYVRITRGEPGMITRLEIEVPADRGFQIGDLTIGGVPISYGGQVADCITVKLIAVATEPKAVKDPKSLRCSTKCYVTSQEPLVLKTATKVPRDGQLMFVREGEQEPVSEGGIQETSYRKQSDQPQALPLTQADNGDR